MSEIQLTTFEKAIYRAVRTLGASAYGVTIAEEIERTTKKEVNIPIMHLALQHLEEYDVLRAQWGERTPERGWKRRRYYYLGPRALDVLEQVYGPIDPDMYKRIYENEPEEISQASKPPLTMMGYVPIRKDRTTQLEWPDMQRFAASREMVTELIEDDEGRHSREYLIAPVQRISRVRIQEIGEE